MIRVASWHVRPMHTQSIAFAGNGPMGITAGALRNVVELLGASEVRNNGSHRRFVSEAGTPFGIPGLDKDTVSPGVLQEVADALEEDKQTLANLCRNPAERKKLKKARKKRRESAEEVKSPGLEVWA